MVQCVQLPQAAKFNVGVAVAAPYPDFSGGNCQAVALPNVVADKGPQGTAEGRGIRY